MNYSLP